MANSDDNDYYRMKDRRPVWLAIVVLGALAWTVFLVATRDAGESHPPSINTHQYSLPGGNFAIEWNLEDGTRCVTVGNSITCEWKR